MSGTKQKTYEINHVGGTLSYVYDNLERVRQIINRHSLQTVVNVRFIQFDYNAGEIEDLRQRAEQMGFAFEVIEGISHPKSNHTRKFLAEANLKKVIERGNANETPEERGEVCPLMFDQLVINCTGDTYLCCAFPNYASFKIGNYLELSEHEILLRRYKHAFCRSCTLPRRPGTENDRIRLQMAPVAVELERRLQAANGELAQVFASKSWHDGSATCGASCIRPVPTAIGAPSPAGFSWTVASLRSRIPLGFFSNEKTVVYLRRRYFNQLNRTAPG